VVRFKSVSFVLRKDQVLEFTEKGLRIKIGFGCQPEGWKDVSEELANLTMTPRVPPAPAEDDDDFYKG
jgi:hypothetical protein